MQNQQHNYAGSVAPVSVYTPVSVYVDTNGCNCNR